MRKSIFLFAHCLLLHTGLVVAQPGDWKPVAGRIMTSWAADVNPASPLPEYPRPQMVRDNWLNLNGLWQYALLPKAQADNVPTAFAGNILVPYAVESA
ncbi:MAG: beta-galactosidase, partial [Cytophagales bacterium]|nr:beta-galactosidase [Cytophagales bacterium]